jgi:two-component system chemotaxis response regulator CheY
MKTLIVEDDFTSRLLLSEFLKKHGPVHIAVNGKEAVDAVRAALDAKEPYNLICMDIMMPEMSGQESLRLIREAENAHDILFVDQAKIVMTTALGDIKNMSTAFSNLCDAYLIKPINQADLAEELRNLKLIA